MSTPGGPTVGRVVDLVVAWVLVAVVGVAALLLALASPLLGLGSGECGLEPDAMRMCDDTYAAWTVFGTATVHLVLALVAFVGVVVATVRRTLAWPWPVAAGLLMTGTVVLAFWLASR